MIHLGYNQAISPVQANHPATCALARSANGDLGHAEASVDEIATTGYTDRLPRRPSAGSG
jgi:hypothetical protein